MFTRLQPASSGPYLHTCTSARLQPASRAAELYTSVFPRRYACSASPAPIPPLPHIATPIARVTSYRAPYLHTSHLQHASSDPYLHTPTSLRLQRGSRATEFQSSIPPR